MSGAVRRRVLRLALLSVAAFVAFLALYALAVHTGVGQRVDQAALSGGAQAPPRAQNAAGRLLSLVSVGALVIAILLLGAVAAARRRPRLVLVPAAVIGATMVSAEVFKKVIFTRPALIDGPQFFFENTYPSGHTAVAISVGLAALLVAPPRLRPLVAFGAATAAAAFGVFVVTAEWHFPSDALGAYALALCVAAAVMAIVLARTPGREAPAEVAELGARGGLETVAGRLERWGVIAAAAFFAGVVVFASLRYGAAIDWNRVDAAYLGSMAVIVVAAALTVSLLLRALAGEPVEGPARYGPAGRIPTPDEERQ